MKKFLIIAFTLRLALAGTALGQGSNPLQITCPPHRTHWVCGGSFAFVNYTAPTTTGSCSGVPTVTCTPPSGALFTLGTTLVTCRATNSCRESATCSFTVTVAHDTTPPVIQCPPSLTVVECGTSGTVVNYPGPTATDNADTNVTIVCSPPSGSVFPFGSTTVTCKATDDCTNQSTCLFIVIVRPPLLYNGLCHSPLGLAALNVNTNDELEVSGFGTNGQDGVRIDLGESQGLRWSMRLPAGDVDGRDFLVWQRGGSPAGADVPISNMAFTFNRGRLTVTPSAASYEFKLLRRGEVVHRQSGRTGSFDIPECHHVEQEHCVGAEFAGLNPNLPYCINFLTIECDWETPSGPIRADALVVTPEDPLPPFTAITSVEIVGRSLPVLTLHTERLLMFGGREQPSIPHRALGRARLVAQDGSLTLADLGSSGTDGVRIELGESKGLVWRMENPPGTPEGDMEIEVLGRTAQGMEVPVRRVTHHYRNGRTSVTPGAGPYQFKLLLRGQVVFQQGGRTGDVDIPECHHVEQEHCVGAAFEGLNPNLPYCLNLLTVECEWETPNGRVRADTLVLTPEGPLPSLATVTAVQIRGRNLRDLPVLTLLEERVLRDTTPPVITCPSNLVLRCLCTNQIIVTDFFKAEAVDNSDPNPTVVCDPPSLVSSPGVHPVTCTATDNCGNRASCTFTVTFLYDTTPPVMQCPANISVATCSNTLAVPYSVPTTDDCGGTVTVVCAPPSGSQFPVGVTVVHCTATDRCGNQSECRFTVTIKRGLVFLSEIEPNNALASAQDLGQPHFIAVVGRVSVAGDVDYYRFTAGPNAKAWITVDTGGAQWLGANSRDSVLTLHNGAGAVIESDDNDGSGNGADSVLESGDASAIAGAALAGGTYYLSVSAVAGQIIAPYRLYLTVTTNDPSPEVEPNATAATATTLIAPGLTHGVRNASLSPTGDADWYTVSVPGPSLLHVSVDGDPERDGTGTDTQVELFRQDAVSVLFSANSSSAGGAVGEGFVYRLSIPGTYFLRVRAGGTTAINGTYRVMAAHCPLPPPPPLGIALRRGGLSLSWPAAIEPCLFRSSRDLRQWSFLDVTPMADGDQLRVELPSSFPQQFFQLVPAGGWSNDSYHCCDSNGQNCSDPVDPLTACPNLVWCHETETQSVCERQ